jgi:hypothetical protein
MIDPEQYWKDALCRGDKDGKGQFRTAKNCPHFGKKKERYNIFYINFIGLQMICLHAQFSKFNLLLSYPNFVRHLQQPQCSINFLARKEKILHDKELHILEQCPYFEKLKEAYKITLLSLCHP